MNLLAIDASTKSTGVAVYQENKLIHSECISASNKSVYTRIDRMIERLKEIIAEYKINSIVIEDVYPEDVKHNQDIYRKLIYLQGFMLSTFDKLNIEPSFYGASEWRSICGIHVGAGIKRGSLKQADIQFVKTKYGIDVNDDIADAICIGWAYLHHNQIQSQFTDDGFEFK